MFWILASLYKCQAKGADSFFNSFAKIEAFFTYWLFVSCFIRVTRSWDAPEPQEFPIKLSAWQSDWNGSFAPAPDTTATNNLRLKQEIHYFSVFGIGIWCTFHFIIRFRLVHLLCLFSRCLASIKQHVSKLENYNSGSKVYLEASSQKIYSSFGKHRGDKRKPNATISRLCELGILIQSRTCTHQDTTLDTTRPNWNQRINKHIVLENRLCAGFSHPSSSDFLMFSVYWLGSTLLYCCCIVLSCCIVAIRN